MKVDLLLTDASILTPDGERAGATQLAVLGGRIVACGDDCDGLSARRTASAGGAVVVPGFNDAHAHSVWFGMTLLEVDLTGTSALGELYDAIAADAARRGAGEWVIACGFNQLNYGGLYPDADELSRAAGGRPVWIKYASGHSCILSRSAMTMLGVTGRERFASGSVVCDADGNPTGRLEEQAMALVRDRLLPASQDTIVRALDAATSRYAQEGLTSVTDAGIGGGWIGHSAQELAAYQRASHERRLRTRMQPMLVSDVLADVPLSADGSMFFGLPGGVRSGLGNEWLQLGPAKFFLDGSILDNTARMSGGYATDPDNHGFFEDDPAVLSARALAAARAGWALALHAVGDDAVSLAIDILTRLADDGITPPLPHRIEHGGVVTPRQLDALAALGTPVVSQPYFIPRFGDGFFRYLGEERSAWSFRMGSYLARGLPVAGSSDRPVAGGRPLDGMQAAVLRTTGEGRVYGPEERLTPAQALRAYTAGAAEVTGWGHAKGRIAPGYLADLVLLDTNPTAVADGEIAAIEVLATLVGGEATFDATGAFPVPEPGGRHA